MLVLTLLTLLIATPLYSYLSKDTVAEISAIQFIRLSSIALFFAAGLSFNCYSPAIIETGLGLYSGLFIADSLTLAADCFICLVAGLVLLPWPTTRANIVAEYPLLALFSTIGSLFLVSSADLVSIYLAIELQSFALYVLATLYRNHESATSAGLKYFLLGALSSALILLGSACVYKFTGLTNLDSISALLAVNDPSVKQEGLVLALMLIASGFLFKVSSAPFHNWAPDVYNGVPTIVTTWLTILPKISVFVLLLGLSIVTFTNQELWHTLLLVCSVLSLIIGTVLGLAQTEIKRLLAYSTISHVGFMLLALGTTAAESVNALLFYVLQYTLTSVATFFILLAFAYVWKNGMENSYSHITSIVNKKGYVPQSNEYQFYSSPISRPDIQDIDSLRAQFASNPLLAFSLLVCLFSMAGVPPMIGFFAKYHVLYVAILEGHYFISLVGVLTSVISAAYYLRVVNVLYFSERANVEENKGQKLVTEKWSHALSSLHSYVIATLTMFILFFVVKPTWILNSTQLIATTLFAS